MNKKVNEKSSNIKKGLFKKEELSLYGLEDNEVEVILSYQKLLPVLQEENGELINARNLHSQLGVKRDFSDWIKLQLNDLDAEEGKDYSLLKGKSSNFNDGRPSVNYNITVDLGKQIAMISGAKGGRTNLELRERSKIARKYFIYIEKAFKNRFEWNLDRDMTQIKCKSLKRALLRYNKEIKKNIPEYFHNNEFIAEFCLLNEVIIGMSASEYKRRKGYSSNYPIRNSFTERELEYVHILEQYDADLIEVQNIFDYETRKEYLAKKFQLLF